MRNNLVEILQDIAEAMDLSLQFINNLNLEGFMRDEKTQFAVIRCLEIIGEAVKRLPDDFRTNYEEVPRKAMAGMRDRLVHGYDVVNPEIVWVTVTQTIVELLPRIREIEEAVQR